MLHPHRADPPLRFAADSDSDADLPPHGLPSTTTTTIINNDNDSQTAATATATAPIANILTSPSISSPPPPLPLPGPGPGHSRPLPPIPMPSSIAIAAVHQDDNINSASASALPPIRRKRPHDLVPDSDSDLDPGPERHSPVRRRYAEANATTTTTSTTTRRADDIDSTAHAHATPANAASMRLQNLTNEDTEMKTAAGNTNASKSLSYPLPDYANKHLRANDHDNDSDRDNDNGDRDDRDDDNNNNIDDNIDIDNPNAPRGMSLPPLARLPRRADTTNTTISAYDVDVDPSNPSSSAAASHLPNLKKYSCDHCGTQFTRHHNLKSHLLTHSEEKPHTCDVCGQRFRRRHDMKRHMKLHTGERPHICVRCGRKFARGDALARHAKGPGGCAGRRESGGSSLGLGDPGDFLSAASIHATDKGRSLSTSSVANVLRDDNGDHVTVTVSNATQDDSDSKAGSRGDPRERLIYTEPDLMDEEDEQNTPLRIRRGGDDDRHHHHHHHHHSADHRSRRQQQHAALQHKHPTAPDTHHLHPSSAYDHYNRHARRSPHDPYTYPMATASATSQESSDCVSHTTASSTRPAIPATLLPSPVSRANSGNSSNDAPSEVLVGTAVPPPTTTLPPAVSISESPKSISPKFQRYKHDSAMHIDSRRLSAHAQRSASPQLLYPHSRIMHSPTYQRYPDQPHRPASPNPNSTNVSSISQLHAQTESQPTGSIPLDQSSTDFKGRTPSLKPRYQAALATLPHPQASSQQQQQQQQISPRQLPIPAGMPTGQSSYLHLSSTHGDIRHNGHQVSRSYMHAQQRRGQGHRHSASSCGSTGSAYRPTNEPNDEGSQLTLSPRHHRASYSHSRSQSVSRPPSHSQPQPQPQSASRPHFSPMPTSVSQHSSTSGGQLLPPASSVTASPSSGITPLTTTAGPVINSSTTLPPFNPMQNSYLQPLPPPRPQRTLSATSAISNPVGSAPLISNKSQLTLPHPEGWAYVQSLEERIASLEAELKEVRAHVFANANANARQIIPPPPPPPPPPMATPATTATATTTGTAATSAAATNTEPDTNA